MPTSYDPPKKKRETADATAVAVRHDSTAAQHRTRADELDKLALGQHGGKDIIDQLANELTRHHTERLANKELSKAYDVEYRQKTTTDRVMRKLRERGNP